MSSDNINSRSILQPKIKIISHRFVVPRSLDNDRYWYAIVVNGKIGYNIEIVENVSYNGEKYYIGYLYNDDIPLKYSSTYLEFGYSDYKNTYRYIIEAMLRVIEGDYSEIKGAGHCIAIP
ncbi:hypothetical protein ACIXR5_12745 [Bacteroides fragilis]|jgi:hypothetical protein|nr:hypothetical protein [Bacteroides fragilis]